MIVVARGHAVGGAGHVWRRPGTILFFSDATSIQVHGSVTNPYFGPPNRGLFFELILARAGCVLKNFGNRPSSIVPKPPKPGFVSFGIIHMRVYGNFLGFNYPTEKARFKPAH
jgi:hypothetical protein